MPSSFPLVLSTTGGPLDSMLGRGWEAQPALGNLHAMRLGLQFQSILCYKASLGQPVRSNDAYLPQPPGNGLSTIGRKLKEQKSITKSPLLHSRPRTLPQTAYSSWHSPASCQDTEAPVAMKATCCAQALSPFEEASISDARRASLPSASKRQFTTSWWFMTSASAILIS